MELEGSDSDTLSSGAANSTLTDPYPWLQLIELVYLASVVCTSKGAVSAFKVSSAKASTSPLLRGNSRGHFSFLPATFLNKKQLFRVWIPTEPTPRCNDPEAGCHTGRPQHCACCTIIGITSVMVIVFGDKMAASRSAIIGWTRDWTSNKESRRMSTVLRHDLVSSR